MVKPETFENYMFEGCENNKKNQMSQFVAELDLYLDFCKVAPKISLKNKTFMIHRDASHVESPICIVAIILINVQILQASTNNFLPNTS